MGKKKKRGRPKVQPRKLRKNLRNIRLSDEEVEQVDAAQSKRGKEFSELVREGLRETGVLK